MKKIFCFILAIFMCAAIVGCTKYEDPVEKDIEMIKSVVGVIEETLEEFGIDKEMIDDVIESVEEYNNETKYVIAFNIKVANNSALNMTLHLPVDEEFFNSVEVGDTVSTEVISDYVDICQDLDDFIVTVENKIVRE